MLRTPPCVSACKRCMRRQLPGTADLHTSPSDTKWSRSRDMLTTELNLTGQPTLNEGMRVMARIEVLQP